MDQAMSVQRISTAQTGEPLVKVRLVPVEVFGTDECDHCGTPAGYGLSDAVSPWSDCNRAIGHIYRRDDIDQRHRDPGDTITVYVPQSELPKLDKRYGWSRHSGEGSGVNTCARRLLD